MEFLTSIKKVIREWVYEKGLTIYIKNWEGSKNIWSENRWFGYGL